MMWTSSDEAQLWARRKAGENFSAIGRALGRPCGTIHRWIKSRGGVAPGLRKRAARVLSLAEREEISRGLSAERSLRQIAAALGRAPSTISREIKRHGG